MIIVVGLGNPGEKFKGTRHNIGFAAIDQLSNQNGFLEWKRSKKANCLYAHGLIAGTKIELVKPLTYMNKSGEAVKYAAKKHRLSPKDIFVAHDDADLFLGEIRIVSNRGAGGHKGIESIIQALTTKNFIRFRIGIKPKDLKQGSRTLEKFVLKKFSKKEAGTVKETVQKTVEAIGFTLKEGTEKAMSTFNK